MASLGIGWSKFRKNARNDGNTNAVGISIPATNWLFNSVGVWSNIVVGTDNKLRFIGTDQKLYCIDAGGNVTWSGSPQYPDDHFNEYSNVVLDGSNNSYVGSRNGTLYKFLADGTRVDHSHYVFCDQPINNIVFATNGKLFNVNNSTSATIPKAIVSYDDLTLDFIQSINLQSQGLIGNQLYGQGIPAVHNDYLAFVLSGGFNADDDNGQLVVVQITDPNNLTSTVIKWSETPYRSFAFPAIDSSGFVYAVKGGNILVKKSLTSAISVFEVTIGAIADRMAPSIDANNNVIIVNAANRMYSITSAGIITWQVDVTGLTGSVGFPVSIDGNNDIYLAQGSKLLKYNSNGIQQWSFDLTGDAVSSPVISDDSYVYVSTTQGINSIKQSAMVQISGYNVYRSTQPNVGFQKINTVVVTDSNYSDINLVSGNYYYLVKAVSIMGVESDKATPIGPLKVNVSSPGKPKNLTSEVVNINNTKGIKLTWDAPLFNNDGTPLTDLAGYDIYRATIAKSSVITNAFSGQLSGAPFDQLSNYTNINKINSSIIPLNTYTDFDVRSGFYYYYSIRAKDLDGNQGPYADEVRGSLSVFKLVLADGKNAIGFPFNDTTLYGSTPDTSNVMQVSKFVDRIGIDKVSKVMRWNENAQVYEQYPDFTTLEAGRGYMIVLITDSSNVELDMSGIDWSKNTGVKFKEKLNLVNLPLNDFTDVRSLVSALGGSQNVEFVARHNKDTGQFEQYIPAVDKGDFTTLEAGVGYYVFMKKSLTDKTINFAGSPWL